MDQRLLFALIGALPGLVPALLMYLQKKKELSSVEPREIMAATTAAEVSMRADLNKQIADLREEIKELKKENNELRKRVNELERLNLGLKDKNKKDVNP